MAGMRLPACALVASACLVGGCTVTVDSHSEILREEKQFKVAGTPDVRLTTFDGSIEIQGWDKSHVAIEIEKRGPTRESLDQLEIVSGQNGNVIELEVKKPRSESFQGIGLRQTAYAKLIVSVPRNAHVRARSGDGSIRIERVNGRLELRTGDGSIRAADVTGDLSFDTSDGSVSVERAEGRLSVDTGDGSVSVSGKLAAVKLHTSDGSVVYRADAGAAMTDNWDITTGDGTVSVYLPPGFSADLDAHTGDGSIRSEIDGLDSPPRDARRTLKGKIGDGGRTLRIRTGDGSIRLRTN
jgi:DUF4097 and DUF4098 domain-containing protein YvlB